MDLLRGTSCLPTVERFDAVRRVAFHELAVVGETTTVAYLQKPYFFQTSVAKVRKAFGVQAALTSDEQMWFAGHWCGVLGTYPGTASGSQTTEAFHSFWQGGTKVASRHRATCLLEVMQGLFRGEWQINFGLSEAAPLGLWPHAPDAALLSGGALRRCRAQRCRGVLAAL